MASHILLNSVFLKNLSPLVTADGIREFLIPHLPDINEILRIDFKYFPGSTQRYCQVDFRTSSGVTAVTALNGQALLGVPLGITVIDPATQTSVLPMSLGATFLGHSALSATTPSFQFPSYSQQSFLANAIRNSTPGYLLPTRETEVQQLARSVHVANVPSGWTLRQIIDYLAGHVKQIEIMTLTVTDSRLVEGVTPGFGERVALLEFKTTEMADAVRRLPAYCRTIDHHEMIISHAKTTVTSREPDNVSFDLPPSVPVPVAYQQLNKLKLQEKVARARALAQRISVLNPALANSNSETPSPADETPPIPANSGSHVPASGVLTRQRQTNGRRGPCSSPTRRSPHRRRTSVSPEYTTRRRRSRYHRKSQSPDMREELRRMRTSPSRSTSSYRVVSDDPDIQQTVPSRRLPLSSTRRSPSYHSRRERHSNSLSNCAQKRIHRPITPDEDIPHQKSKRYSESSRSKERHKKLPRTEDHSYSSPVRHREHHSHSQTDTTTTTNHHSDIKRDYKKEDSYDSNRHYKKEDRRLGPILPDYRKRRHYIPNETRERKSVDNWEPRSDSYERDTRRQESRHYNYSSPNRDRPPTYCSNRETTDKHRSRSHHKREEDKYYNKESDYRTQYSRHYDKTDSKLLTDRLRSSHHSHYSTDKDPIRDTSPNRASHSTRQKDYTSRYQMSSDDSDADNSPSSDLNKHNSLSIKKKHSSRRLHEHKIIENGKSTQRHKAKDDSNRSTEQQYNDDKALSPSTNIKQHKTENVEPCKQSIQAIVEDSEVLEFEVGKGEPEKENEVSQRMKELKEELRRTLKRPTSKLSCHPNSSPYAQN